MHNACAVARNVRIDARSIRPGTVELIDTTTKGGEANFVASEGTEGPPPAGCVPRCPNGHAVTVVPAGPPPGGANSGNSGNSGAVNSGNSANSGSGSSGTRSVQSPAPAGTTPGNVTAICSRPPPGGANSGNSGNSGNG